MGRTPCCSHEELKKGAWTVQEDQKLIGYIQRDGTGNWSTLPQKAGLQRCGKSCRLRWFNYLRPGIKRGQLSQEEKHTIIKLHGVLGNRWSSIAKHLPMRTDNEIKNYWNSYLKKHLEENKGLDPLTPKPISTTTSSSSDSETITAIESSSTDINMVPSKSNITHHSQQGSSKLTSSSSSTNLLNKVARKIVGSGYLDAVKSSSWQHVTENNNTIDNVTKSVTEYKAEDSVMQCHSHSSSTSARLLNKMATSLSQRVQCHEAARAAFSKFIMGGCEKSEDHHAITSTFEDGPYVTSGIGSFSCFLDNKSNADNWQCAKNSSDYTSFGNCGVSGGCSSVSEVNLVSNGTGKCYSESSNSITSCFIDEDAAAAASFDDELIEILRYDDEINMYI